VFGQELEAYVEGSVVCEVGLVEQTRVGAPNLLEDLHDVLLPVAHGARHGLVHDVVTLRVSLQRVEFLLLNQQLGHLLIPVVSCEVVVRGFIDALHFQVDGFRVRVGGQVRLGRALEVYALD